MGTNPRLGSAGVFAAVMMIMGGIWQGLAGQTWARGVGITLAVLSAMANFLFIPSYPFWSMLIIAVDVFVVGALAAHGRELKEFKDYRSRLPGAPGRLEAPA